jgi:hypothetical protein
MQTIKKPISASLARFELWLDDAQLICWVDFERGDASVGLNPSAWLYHAFVGDSGMDVAELLSDDIVSRIEADAAAELDGDMRRR